MHDDHDTDDAIENPLRDDEDLLSGDEAMLREFLAGCLGIDPENITDVTVFTGGTLSYGVSVRDGSYSISTRAGDRPDDDNVIPFPGPRTLH